MTRKIGIVTIAFLLISGSFIFTDFVGMNTNVNAAGFPSDIHIEIHRIMEIDETDFGSGADWYFYVGVDGGSGYQWKQSSVPVASNLNHLLLNDIFTFTVSTSPVSVAMYLCEDDLWFDDLADISSYPGEGNDDSTSFRRGATCIVTYDVYSHSWTGDVSGSTSSGYSETNGQWDGSAGSDTNDAALWFMIWDDMRVEIIHPVFAVPLIKPKSDTFDIDVRLDCTNSPATWESTIFTEYDSYDLQINNVVQIGADNWKLTVRAPPDARCDLYDLKVEIDGVWDTEPNSISLIDSFSSDLKFIQITDLHIDDPQAEFGGGLGDSVVEADVLSSVIKEINLINPDFVVATGDIGDNPEGIWQNEVRQYERAREVLLKLRIPVYIVNGNHDYDCDTDEDGASIDNYMDILNPYRDFSWDYGPHHFVGLDSGEKNAYYGLPGCMMGTGLINAQMNWIQTDLASHGGGGLNFMFMHHTALDPDECPDFPYYNSSISKNQMQFLDLCKQNQVAMVLTGHTHIDEVWDRDGIKQTGSSAGSPTQPIYIQTRSVTHDDYGDHGFRLIKISGSSVRNYTYDANNNGQRDASSSIPAGQLGVAFSPGNDGTFDSVTATVTNNLHETFSDARIIFAMPKPQPGKQYYALNGLIEQSIERPTHDIYYVLTDLPKDSTKDVILQQGYPIDLAFGWNLISLPLIQWNSDLKTVLSSIAGSYDAVQWYDSSGIADQWKHYHISKSSPGRDLTDLDHTMGLWIHITEPGGATLLLEGTVPTASQTVPLHTGWNMVGYPSPRIHNVTNGLNNLGFGLQVDAIWAFDSATQSWEGVDPSDSFEIGRGYWIHATQECVWEVPV